MPRQHELEALPHLIMLRHLRVQRIVGCGGAGEATRHGSSVSEGQSRAFLDCWFTLAALEKDPGEQKRIYNIIRKAGGRVFDSGRLSLVTNLAGAYAVCPLGFPPPARKEAMCHPDFKRGTLPTPSLPIPLPAWGSMLMCHAKRLSPEHAWQQHAGGSVN